MNTNPLSDFIKARRDAMRWSCEDVSQRALVAGHIISESYVGMLERIDPKTGRTSIPGLAKIEALAAGLGVPVSDVMEAVNAYADILRGSPRKIGENYGKQASNDMVMGTHAEVASVVQPAALRSTVPIYGPTAAGPAFSWTDEHERGQYPITEAQRGMIDAMFVVRGASLSGRRIHDGDMLGVRLLKGERPRDGQIVVVQHEGAYLAKTYRKNAVGEYLESHEAEQAPAPLLLDDATLIGVVRQIVHTLE